MNGRSAAFLEEMGIGPLWTLRGSVEVVLPEAAQADAKPYRPEPSPALPPPPVYQPGHEPRAPMNHPPAPGSAWVDDGTPAPATDAEIAVMDWAQLRAAIASCTRCGLCAGTRKAVYGDGARQAVWLVAAGATTLVDEQEKQPIAGTAGTLLANMLAAVGLSRQSNAYVTNLVKCRPSTASGGERAPTDEEARACKPYLQREVALTGAGMVLTMGQIAANALLDKPLAEPLAAARGAVHAVNAVPLVATLHPAELLRRGADKALAWADLCLARAHDGRSG